MSPIMNSNTQARFQEVISNATNGDIGIGKVADVLYAAILHVFTHDMSFANQDYAVNNFLDAVEKELNDT